MTENKKRDSMRPAREFRGWHHIEIRSNSENSLSQLERIALHCIQIIESRNEGGGRQLP